jgi:hypothetical protein
MNDVVVSQEAQATVIAAREIFSDILPIVKAVASGFTLIPKWPSPAIEELATLVAQAKDMVAVVEDFEGPARAAGWKTADMTPGMVVKGVVGQAQAESAMGWREACQKDGLEPNHPSVKNCYIVSKRLGEDLKMLGEYVETNFAGKYVWVNWRDNPKQMLVAVVALREKLAQQAAAGLPPPRYTQDEQYSEDPNINHWEEIDLEIKREYS